MPGWRRSPRHLSPLCFWHRRVVPTSRGIERAHPPSFGNRTTRSIIRLIIGIGRRPWSQQLGPLWRDGLLTMYSIARDAFESV